MKSISDILSNQEEYISLISLAMDQKSETKSYSSKYLELKKWMFTLPSEITTAIKKVSEMPSIEKNEQISEKGKITLFFKKSEDFDFMFEIQNNNKKGIVRAWYTLYDNKKSICSLRDLLIENKLNTI